MMAPMLGHNDNYFHDVEKGQYDDNVVLCETTPTYIRHGFIRKVCYILAAQFSLTVLICALIVINKVPFLSNITSVLWINVTLPISFFGIVLITLFYPSLLRKYPWNYIILLIETVHLSFSTGYLCAVSEPKLILMAAITTLIIVFIIFLFTLQTKIDFTSYIIYAIILSVVCLCLSIGFIFVSATGYKIAYLCIGTISCAFWLVIDMQMILGGRTYEWTIDDYVPAALCLYTDIIVLFTRILSIITHN